MADKNIVIQRNNGGTIDNVYPQTQWGNVLNKPTTFTPTSHSHGQITDTGTITTDTAVASGQKLVVVNGSNQVARSTLAFGTGTTTFLRNDGTFATPAGGGNVSTSGTITANTIPYWVDTTSIGTLVTTTYPTLTELSYVKGVTSALQTQLNAKQATLTNPVTGTGTTNQIAYYTGSTSLASLNTTTYPSLTELSYVKGVTSAIQTQINGIQFDPQRTQLFSATSSASDTTYTATTGDYSTYKMLYIEMDRGGIQKASGFFRISDIGDGVGGSGPWHTLVSTSTTNGTTVVMLSISRASSSGTGNTFRVRTSGLGTSYTLKLSSLGNID
jgi:hypothetical protein